MSIKHLSETALAILKKRYLGYHTGDKNLRQETPEEMMLRVAHFVALAEPSNPAYELWKQKFYSLLCSLDFLPNSPTLMNGGIEYNNMCSACFVLPIEDSMEDIFTTVKHAALIAKAGGGLGYSFGRLRPQGSSVQGTQRVSGGPISFMGVFNSIGGIIKQGGRRATAQMAVLPVNHPDIEDFIICKDQDGDLESFNISVAITKDFMEAVINGGFIDLVFNDKVYETVCAPTLWNKIIHQAWKNGEPGIIFLDEINGCHPISGELIEATNPCGEQPLLPNECCNLGSINLANHIRSVGSTAFMQAIPEKDTIYDVWWEKLEETVSMAVRFLDNIIDVQSYPLESIKDITKKHRKIGLGVMGWADMLVKMRMSYDSKEAFHLALRVMEFINRKAHKASEEIGIVKGHCDVPGIKRRNATCTTIAPTGTISMIADVSSGIEPPFAREYTKNVLEGESFLYKHPKADEPYFRIASEISPRDHVKMQAAFQKFTDNAVSKTINLPADATERHVNEAFMLAYALGCKGITVYRDGSRDRQVLTIPKPEELSGVTSFHKGEDMGDAASDKKIEDYYRNFFPGHKEEIHPPDEHVRALNECLAKNIDKELTEIAEKADDYKYKEGAKDLAETIDKDILQAVIEEAEREEYLCGRTYSVTTGCGRMYITINENSDGRAVEVFCVLGKTGGCASANTQTIGRLASLALQSGLGLDSIQKSLSGIRCNNIVLKERSILSCADAVAYVLGIYLDSKLKPKSPSALPIVGPCPDCGNSLVKSEGCNLCQACGYSKCG